MNLGAVILAAGASRRMGSPKALLTVDGETFVDRQIRLLSSCCTRIVVVVGVHGSQIRDASKLGTQVTFVDNPDPDRGMLSSLQCGLAALPGDLTAWLFTPVDLPNLRIETVKQLAAQAGSSAFCIPCHAGRRGHPVLVDGRLRSEFMEAGTGQTPRDLIEGRRDSVTYLDVDDAGVCIDVDTPEEYRAAVVVK
ncbi:MAG: nucleotidyltransferase family protein [Bryobacterales bacterium]|nr:nucleotidyltransferase family protein [Bryobacterales bacterium]